MTLFAIRLRQGPLAFVAPVLLSLGAYALAGLADIPVAEAKTSLEKGRARSLGVVRATDDYLINPNTGRFIVPIEIPNDPANATQKFTVVNADMNINCRFAIAHPNIAKICDKAFGQAWRNHTGVRHSNQKTKNNTCLLIKNVRFAVSEVGQIEMIRDSKSWIGGSGHSDEIANLGRQKDRIQRISEPSTLSTSAETYQISRECNQSIPVSFLNSAIVSSFWEFSNRQSMDQDSFAEIFYSKVVGSVVGEIFHLIRSTVGDLSTPNPTRLQMVTRLLSLETFTDDIANRREGWGDAASKTGRWSLIYEFGRAPNESSDDYDLNIFVGIKSTFDISTITSGCGMIDQLLNSNYYCGQGYRKRTSPPPQLKEHCDPQASQCRAENTNSN